MSKAKRKKKLDPEFIQLQRDYAELLKKVESRPLRLRRYSDNLAQPETLRYVPSVTTYGAYEEPI